MKEKANYPKKKKKKKNKNKIDHFLAFRWKAKIHITSIKQIKLRRDLAMVFQSGGRLFEQRTNWDERNSTLSI